MKTHSILLMTTVWLISMGYGPTTTAAVPYGHQWQDGRYVEDSMWFSAHLDLGVRTHQLNGEIVRESNHSAPGTSVGATLHLGHELAIPFVISSSSLTFSDSEEFRGASWNTYEFSSTLVSTGVQWSAVTREALVLYLQGNLGLNFEAHELVGIGVPWTWNGVEPTVGGEVGILFYPLQPLEIGATIRVDALMGGGNDAYEEWKGVGIVSDTRTSGMLAFRAGIHF